MGTETGHFLLIRIGPGTGGSRVGGDEKVGELGDKDGKTGTQFPVGRHFLPKEVVKDVIREQASKRLKSSKTGKPLCWGFVSHSGCRVKACKYEHEIPKDPAWYNQLTSGLKYEIICRGGPVTGTKMSVEQAKKLTRYWPDVEKVGRYEDVPEYFLVNAHAYCYPGQNL